MKTDKKIIFSWIAVFLCMAVIFILSAQKAVDSQNISDRFIILFGLKFSSDFVRTVAHFLEYAGLSVLVYNAIYQSLGCAKPVISVVICAVYAVTDEIHQLFVEGRACQITDIIIDTAGAIVGVAVLSAIIFVYKKIKRRIQV